MSRIGFAFVLALALLRINLLFSQQLEEAAAAFEQGRMAEADQKLNSFLKNHPADLRALILKGAVLDTLQRWDENSGAFLPTETLLESAARSTLRSGVPSH